MAAVARPAAIAGTVAVGVLAALQARINGELGVELGDGVLAAVISYASGLILVALLIAPSPVARTSVRKLVTALRERSAPTWWVLASLAGAVAVLAQGLTVGLLGVALFGVGIVAGRTITSVFVDAIGLGGSGVRRATGARLAGAALTIVAVVIAALGGRMLDVAWWALALPVLAGACVAFQQAANGGIVRVSGSGMAAAALNFSLGTVLLVALWLVRMAFGVVPQGVPAEPWLYAGGLVGVLFIVLSAQLVRHVGVLILGIGVVVGQLVASVAFDLLWPIGASSGPRAATLGVAVAICAAVVASEPWARSRRVLAPGRR